MAGTQAPVGKAKKINLVQQHYEPQGLDGSGEAAALSATSVGGPASAVFDQRGSHASTAHPARRPAQNFPGAKLGSSSHKKLVLTHYHPAQPSAPSSDATASFLTSNETLTGTALSPSVAKGTKLPPGQSKAKAKSPDLASKTVRDGPKHTIAQASDKHHLHLRSK